MVAFLATAIVTYLVILGAYFGDCLPEVSLNEVDSFIMRKPNPTMGQPTVIEKKKAKINEIAMSERTDIEKGRAKVNEMEDLTIGKSTDIEKTSKASVSEVDGCKPKDDKERKRERIKNAIEAFIVALSDQQLVTGLAILIAGFVKCDISNYLFSNVWAIAWFSCMTHLATLMVLRR